jgi:hypothetical protein
MALLSERSLLRSNGGAVVSDIFCGVRAVAVPWLEDYNQAMVVEAVTSREDY